MGLYDTAYQTDMYASVGTLKSTPPCAFLEGLMVSVRCLEVLIAALFARFTTCVAYIRLLRRTTRLLSPVVSYHLS